MNASLPLVVLSMSALLAAGSAAAQGTRDSGSRDSQPAQDPAPAAKDQDARIRSGADAAAGGTGDPTARGDRVRGPGTPQAGSTPSQGRVHSEQSSDREEGRGADARGREVVPGGRDPIRQERRTP